MCKDTLTESEFDKLAPQSQVNYMYCPKCDIFYLSTAKSEHNHAYNKEQYINNLMSNFKGGKLNVNS